MLPSARPAQAFSPRPDAATGGSNGSKSSADARLGLDVKLTQSDLDQLRTEIHSLKTRNKTHEAQHRMLASVIQARSMGGIPVESLGGRSQFASTAKAAVTAAASEDSAVVGRRDCLGCPAPAAATISRASGGARDP